MGELALKRLGQREGAAIVGRVVGDKSLPKEVTAQIVAKTDGGPLFVEELPYQAEYHLAYLYLRRAAF